MVARPTENSKLGDGVVSGLNQVEDVGALSPPRRRPTPAAGWVACGLRPVIP
jgi:hypothetical protein